MEKPRTEYRVSVVNVSGEVFKRTTYIQRTAELLWGDVNGASHVLYAAFFEDGKLVRQFVKRATL